MGRLQGRIDATACFLRELEHLPPRIQRETMNQSSKKESNMEKCSVCFGPIEPHDRSPSGYAHTSEADFNQVVRLGCFAKAVPAEKPSACGNGETA
jgi:hypothetical protein